MPQFKLNIGGTVFVTTDSTLNVIPGSVFSAITDGRWSTDLDGAFFFDRNPRYFTLILDAMRERAAGIAATIDSSHDHPALRADLSFYQVEGLLHDREPADEPASQLDIEENRFHRPGVIWRSDCRLRGRIAKFQGVTGIVLDAAPVLRETAPHAIPRIAFDLTFFTSKDEQEQSRMLDHLRMAAKERWIVEIEGTKGRLVTMQDISVHCK